MNDADKEIDIPWLKTHFNDEEPESVPDPDFIVMLEELEYK